MTQKTYSALYAFECDLSYLDAHCDHTIACTGAGTRQLLRRAWLEFVLAQDLHLDVVQSVPSPHGSFLYRCRQLKCRIYQTLAPIVFHQHPGCVELPCRVVDYGDTLYLMFGTLPAQMPSTQHLLQQWENP